MNGPGPPNPAAARENPCDVDAASDLLCPLSRQPVGTDQLTSALCNDLEEAGCPIAPAIQERLRFEALLTELSATFVNVAANQVDSQIESGLRNLVELFGLDRVGLGEVSADGSKFIVTHSYQLPGIPPSSQMIVTSQIPTFARMIRQARVVRIPDDLPDEATPEREYIEQTGLKSNLSIPLTVMGTVVGGIGFSSFRSRRVWPDELIPRLRLVGDIFTNALARKRADEELQTNEQSLRQTRQRLEHLASQLLDAQEEESRRIAREMHDDWTQRLAILSMDAATLEAHLGEREEVLPLLAGIREKLVNLSEDVHALSRQLHPSILEDLGLVEALRSECDSFSRRSGITIKYRPEKVPDKLPTDIALCVYRVAQEGLRNLAKHAAVNEGLVTLAYTESEVVMRVRDQGAGFNLEDAYSQLGLGLSSMEERVRLIQGKLSITSAPGQGTTVEVSVPLPESKA